MEDNFFILVLDLKFYFLPLHSQIEKVIADFEKRETYFANIPAEI